MLDGPVADENAVAAVDCGTNSTRLLIASGEGRAIDRRMRITRLGAGVDRTGRLAPDAIERTLVVLRQFRQAMDEHRVRQFLATATSAVRDAANADDFVRPAADILGAPPRVLPGTAEGRLSYRGATAELDPLAGPYLVVDIGGGSTELVTAVDPTGSEGASGSGERGANDVTAVSLDVGCVRVTERFLCSDPPEPHELARAAAYVRGLLEATAEEHPGFRHAKRLVGLAGTVSALGVLGLGLTEYSRESVHHSVLTRDRVDELVGELSAVPLAERRERPGVEKERADVLVGGALILATVMDGYGFSDVLVSESDILDGIVAELLEPAGIL